MAQIDAIPAFSDNYIWHLHGAGEHWVVDPGDANPVIERLDALGAQLTGILVTHHHFDHIGGLNDLIERYQPRIIAPHNPAIEPAELRVKAGDSVNAAGLDFRVIEVPGHTLDHIAYFSDKGDRPVLFCGDTLFAGGCGRIFEGDPAMMLASLQKLATLPADTACYCAHEYTLANLAFAAAVEPKNQALQSRISACQTQRSADIPTVPSFLSEELATNPFLRYQQPEVIEAAQQQEPGISGDTAVFAAIREWKNNF